MRQLVLEGQSDPLVANYARRVAASTPHLHPVEAIFRHVQAMPYAYDEDILAQAGYDADTSEMLMGPQFQIGKSLLGGPGSVVGDCDDRAILTQSLLESQGVPTRFVLVRGPGRDDYSHVYSEASVDGQWLPLDTIMDGRGGRPFFGPGQEVGLPDARDRMTVGVNEVPAKVSGLPLLALAALLFWR
jgi:transglutaminase-like putative cysteine protease